MRGKESRPTARDQFESIWSVVAVGIDPNNMRMGIVKNGKLETDEGEQAVLVWANQEDAHDKTVTPPRFQARIKSISALVVSTEEIIKLSSNQVQTTPEFKDYPEIQVTTNTLSILAKLASINFENAPAV